MYVTHYCYMVHKNMWGAKCPHVSNQSNRCSRILSIKSVQISSEFRNYTDVYRDLCIGSYTRVFVYNVSHV